MQEELYKDFTEKILPKVSEGLMITKDYFTDLFGRYAHYLIVSDAVKLGIALFMLFVCVLTLFLLRKKIAEWNDEGEFQGVALPIVLCILSLVFFIITIVKTDDLIKSIYIPELRMYEQLSWYRSASK